VWIAASVVLALSDPDGVWGLALRVVATAALSWWAVDEIVRGMNPWRRLLALSCSRRGGVAASLTAALDGPLPWGVGAIGPSHEAPGRQHGCLPRR